MGQAPAVCNPFTASADLVLTRFIRPPFQRPDMSWWPEREHPELFKGAAPLSLSPSKEHSKHAELKGGRERSITPRGCGFLGTLSPPPHDGKGTWTIKSDEGVGFVISLAAVTQIPTRGADPIVQYCIWGFSGKDNGNPTVGFPPLFLRQLS